MQRNPRSIGALIGRYLPLAGVAALSLFNGSLYSPIYDSVDQMLYLFGRGAVHVGPMPLPYRTTLFIAVMTLLIGGIPAAIYERLRGLRQSSPVSMCLWLLTTLVLTVPTLEAATGSD